MLTIADLKPLQRQCLLACLSDPNHKLTRVRGGFAPPNDRAQVFTMRTVNGLESVGLLRRADAFAAEAFLTTPGVCLAAQLQDAARAKAGVA